MAKHILAIDQGTTSTRAILRFSSLRSPSSSVIGLQWWKFQVFGPVVPIGRRA